ncbi:OadG family protein [uncultured Selenomonas sp.]|uniref:OadG family protein n=1 Tax=uncultured Selenomonas sp. TaxID=159275 RepID=UPI0028DD3552|nr:OadG family protein [uncultured Selenomonas sp.]
MSQPVTTNPLIIMLINMTVVFIVLISLSFLIRLIHAFDPTRKKEAPTPAASPAPAPVAAPEPEGLSAEVVAAITAAVTLCGFSGGAIRTIRPLARDGWKNSGRTLR